MTATPKPPENVRIIFADETEAAVDCRYLYSRDGIHCWEVATRFDPAKVRGIKVDLLPAKTQIALPIAGATPE